MRRGPCCPCPAWRPPAVGQLPLSPPVPALTLMKGRMRKKRARIGQLKRRMIPVLTTPGFTLLVVTPARQHHQHQLHRHRAAGTVPKQGLERGQRWWDGPGKEGLGPCTPQGRKKGPVPEPHSPTHGACGGPGVFLRGLSPFSPLCSSWGSAQQRGAVGTGRRP